MSIQLRTCYRCGVEFQAQYGNPTLCDSCRSVQSKTHAIAGDKLTPRQWQIVHQVMAAESNKIIAFNLHLTEGTVKQYVKRIFAKLQLHNRTQLALWGVAQETEQEVEQNTNAETSRLKLALLSPWTLLKKYLRREAVMTDR